MKIKQILYFSKTHFITGLSEIQPSTILNCVIKSEEIKSINLKCRIDTNKELEYYKAGGILNYVSSNNI